jgi:hypothetical protein
MDPLSLLRSIFSAAQTLHEIHKGVKVNKAQCAALNARVQSMENDLRALEARERRKPRQSMYQAESDSPMGKQAPPTPLQILLSCVDDCVTMVRKFSDAGWAKRVWNKSNYSDDFASLMESLSQAQAGLGIHMQIDQQQAARDAQADLAAIKEDAAAIQEGVRRLEALQHAHGERQLAYAQHHFQRAEANAADMKADLRSEMEKFMQKVQKQLQGAAAPKASASASSSKEGISDQVLHIPLSDLRMDPEPIGGGGFGDVYR